MHKQAGPCLKRVLRDIRQKNKENSISAAMNGFWNAEKLGTVEMIVTKTDTEVTAMTVHSNNLKRGCFGLFRAPDSEVCTLSKFRLPPAE